MSNSNKNKGGYNHLQKMGFIELKKHGRVKLRPHYFDKLEDIQDLKWNHTNPIIMLREEDHSLKEVKEEDRLHSSRLFTTMVIPFLLNFLKLVLEVVEHIDFI